MLPVFHDGKLLNNDIHAELAEILIGEKPQ
jgi:hypothetical protein